MSNNHEIELKRDCEAIQIPAGSENDDSSRNKGHHHAESRRQLHDRLRLRVVPDQRRKCRRPRPRATEFGGEG